MLHTNRPTFDPRKNLAGFETLKEAKQQRSELIKFLDGQGLFPELAAALKGCRRGHRCNSGGCRICLRLFRTKYVRAVAPQLMFGKWYAVSLVADHWALGVGELERFDVNAVKDCIRKQIERSEIADCVVIGALDIAVQAFSNRASKIRLHFYFFVRHNDKAAIKRAFKRLYPAGPDTRKPLQIRKVQQTQEDVLKASSYSFKSRFNQRMPCIDFRGNASTRDREVSIEQLAELHAYLHLTGFRKRIFYRGELPFRIKFPC